MSGHRATDETSPGSAPVAERSVSKTDEEKIDSAVKWLIGSFGTVSAVLAGLGAVNGGLERMLRNHPVGSLFAFTFTSLAIGLAVMAQSAFYDEPGEDGGPWGLWAWLFASRKRLIALSALSFMIGLVLVTWWAVITPSSREQPTVTARFATQEGLSLVGSVKASGIKSDEIVTISVDGLTREDNGELRFVDSIFDSDLGPNPAGILDVPLDVAVPTGRFELVGVSARFAEEASQKCRKDDPNEGCVVLRVPNVSLRPQLSATWQGTAPDALVLALGINADGLTVDDAVAVVVEGKRPRGSTKRLFSAMFSPDSRGRLDTIVEMPAPAEVTIVCAKAVTRSASDSSEAATSPPPTSSPPLPNRCEPVASAPWIEIRVPRSARRHPNEGPNSRRGRSDDSSGTFRDERTADDQ
jgi:hypothetical protein